MQYLHAHRVDDVHIAINDLQTRRIDLLMQLHQLKNNPPQYSDDEIGRIESAVNQSRVMHMEQEAKTCEKAVRAILNAAIV